MSQIAAALARHKGKKVAPISSQESVVPAIHTSVPPMPMRAAPQAKNRKPLALAVIGGSSAVALLLIAGWAFLPKAPPPLPPAPITAPQMRIAAPAAPAPAQTVKLPAEKTADAAAARMAPEIEDQLSKLNITARRSGKGSRIVVGGKMFEPGDIVLADVVLDSVLPDRIVFRNPRNQRFERRL